MGFGAANMAGRGPLFFFRGETPPEIDTNFHHVSCGDKNRELQGFVGTYVCPSYTDNALSNHALYVHTVLVRTNFRLRTSKKVADICSTQAMLHSPLENTPSSPVMLISEERIATAGPSQLGAYSSR